VNTHHQRSDQHGKRDIQSAARLHLMGDRKLAGPIPFWEQDVVCGIKLDGQDGQEAAIGM
jgi:hypothetical protein